MDFREKLKLATAGKNKAQLSVSQGLAATTISNYLASGSIPRADIAYKIATALNLPIDWMLDDTRSWPPPAPSALSLTTEDLAAELGRRMQMIAASMVEKLKVAEATPWIDIAAQLAVSDPDKLPKKLHDLARLYGQLNALARELDRCDPPIPLDDAGAKEEVHYSDLIRRHERLSTDAGFELANEIGSLFVMPSRWRAPWFDEQLKTIRAEVANRVAAEKVRETAKITPASERAASTAGKVARGGVRAKR